MVNRNDSRDAREFDDISDKDTRAVLAEIPELLSYRRPRLREGHFNDELIVTLSDSYENKRARQVNEWERKQHVERVM